MYNKLSNDDLRMMFEDTIVLFKNYPVNVARAGGGRLYIHDIITGDFLDEVPPDNKDFNFLPAPLGNINLENNFVYYAQRLPQRQYKIGLCTQSLHTRMVGHEPPMSSARSAYKKPLIETILGNYPTKEKAIEGVEKLKRGCIAFDRFFSVDQDLNLYHKWNKVGMLNAENGKPMFHASKRYLKLLME